MSEPLSQPAAPAALSANQVDQLLQTPQQQQQNYAQPNPQPQNYAPYAPADQMPVYTPAPAPANAYPQAVASQPDATTPLITPSASLDSSSAVMGANYAQPAAGQITHPELNTSPAAPVAPQADALAQPDVASPQLDSQAQSAASNISLPVQEQYVSQQPAVPSVAPTPSEQVNPVFAQWRALIENLEATYKVAAPHLTEQQRAQWGEVLSESQTFVNTHKDFGAPDKIAQAFQGEILVKHQSANEKAALHYAEITHLLARVVEPEKAAELFQKLSEDPGFNPKQWLQGVALNQPVKSVKDIVKTIHREDVLHLPVPENPHHQKPVHHVDTTHLQAHHSEHGGQQAGAADNHAAAGTPVFNTAGLQPQGVAEQGQPQANGALVEQQQSNAAIPAADHSHADRVGHAPAPQSLGTSHADVSANVASGFEQNR